MNAAQEPPKSVITGASQGTGAGVAPGYPEHFSRISRAVDSPSRHGR